MITGGAGFLGSHLCDYFIAKGWDVLCLDNLVTGADSNSPICFRIRGFALSGRTCLDISKYKARWKLCCISRRPQALPIT